MFSTMKKKKIPKLLLTTIVKTDGLGDLSHFFDIDNYFATSDEVGEHDCERVVVCYKKNKEITIKRMKENGYQIIEFDENGHSLTEIDPNKKQVHLIVLDYVGDNTKINPFFEQHKELTAGLNYAISVSTNLFESEFITVNDFNKYFTQKINLPIFAVLNIMAKSDIMINNLLISIQSLLPTGWKKLSLGEWVFVQRSTV